MRARVLLLLTALAIPLVAFECIARHLDWYTPAGTRLTPTRPDLYAPDPTVGYRLHPSLRATVRYPPRNPRVLSVVANSDGFRSPRELGESDPRTRILVVGDSFVFGSGVEASERFTEILELLEPGWRIDNLGMTGWGIDLMLRAIEAFGPKARPDIVLLAVYTDDFRRVAPTYAGLGHAVPKFGLVDGQLESFPYPRPGVFERLRLVQLLFRLRPAVERNYYALNSALLDRYRAVTEQLAAAPVVLFLPGREDNPEDKQRRRFLGNWAARNDVPFVDLTDTIRGAGVSRLYIPRNFHWNPEGHRIAADAIHRRLKKLRPNLP